MVKPRFVSFILLLVNLGVCAEQPAAAKRNEGDILFTVVSNAGSKGKWIHCLLYTSDAADDTSEV